MNSPRAKRSACSARTAPARPRLFGIITGMLAPNSGRVLFDGSDITARSAVDRCRLGIARSFQIPQPFGGMTVFENLVVAGAFAKGRRERDVYDLSAQILEDCELGEKANVKADTLTLLDRKRLELARALATRPQVAAARRGRRRL